jgi:rare lipoprotein A (peptidoglycan hydrolase)
MPQKLEIPAKPEQIRTVDSKASLSRIIGLIAAGVVPAVCWYACAARPAPQPIQPVVATLPSQPVATPTPASHAPASHVVKASWYGPGLAGQKTTSGEPFNPKALTAASKNLPIGSVVKVTNPVNGKSVNVRINDRGPFVRGRSLDLSQHAAEKIGIVHKGVVPVKVSKPPEASSQPEVPEKETSSR